MEPLLGTMNLLLTCVHRTMRGSRITQKSVIKLLLCIRRRISIIICISYVQFVIWQHHRVHLNRVDNVGVVANQTRQSDVSDLL